MKKRSSQSGFALVTVLVLTAVIAIISGSVLHMAGSGLRSARRWHEADQCLLAAQSAIDVAKIGINEEFRDYYIARLQSGHAIDWFDEIEWFEETGTFPSTSIGTGEYVYNLPQGTNIYGSRVYVSIHDVEDSDSRDFIQKSVLMVSSAECANASRTISEVVTFGLEMTRIFDYAYFINNFGWFWGNAITANGDVRANGNFSFRYDPIVNGDAYGAVNPNIPGSGDVEGSWRHADRSSYANNAPSGARPMSPANESATNQIPWPMGFDENVKEHPFHKSLEMPYLGDLETYEAFASQYDGKVRQIKHGNARDTLIDNVYSGTGPDDVANTPDDGTIILIGTEDKPIEIDGPVVIKGDLIIKGRITGQGCFYVGRNIHVVDSIIYDDPPQWGKPDNDPFQTATLNENKDLVGFAAKGNIILGDYTSSVWRNNVLGYMRPSFTAGYDTDASDFGLGYDSDNDPDNGYYFNGDYTAYDGGLKLDDDGSTENRKYYQSTLSDDHFHSLATFSVDRMDGVYYNNHALGGRAGNSSDGFVSNGSLVARDEAIIFSSSLSLNWDIRLGSRSKEVLDNFFYFPQTLAAPHTIRWWESP